MYNNHCLLSNEIYILVLVIASAQCKVYLNWVSEKKEFTRCITPTENCLVLLVVRKNDFKWHKINIYSVIALLWISFNHIKFFMVLDQQFCSVHQSSWSCMKYLPLDIYQSINLSYFDDICWLLGWNIMVSTYTLVFHSSVGVHEFTPLFSSPGPKVHVNYCHHLASVVCRL